MMVPMARTMMTVAMSIALLCNYSVVVSGFSSPSAITATSLSTSKSTSSSSSSSSVLYAGFGGGGETSKNKNKKNKINKTDKNKLKPKTQWDRYIELKYEPKIPVAVQIDGTTEWLNVGCVKSQESKHTVQAVFRQRAIIADHAKRLHPIQLAPKGKQQLKLNWGFYEFTSPATATSAEKDDDNEDGDDNEEQEGQWTVVDKSTAASSTEDDGIEKLIGFMGRPDPVSGFYCQYDGGRITSSPLSSAGQDGGKSGSGGPVTGSNKKGPGDGVI